MLGLKLNHVNKRGPRNTKRNILRDIVIHQKDKMTLFLVSIAVLGDTKFEKEEMDAYVNSQMTFPIITASLYKISKALCKWRNKSWIKWLLQDLALIWISEGYPILQQLLSQYKDGFSRYRDFHSKDKTAVKPWYFYNGDPYTPKTTSLYWDGPGTLCVSDLT